MHLNIIDEMSPIFRPVSNSALSPQRCIRTRQFYSRYDSPVNLQLLICIWNAVIVQSKFNVITPVKTYIARLYKEIEEK